MIKGRFFTTTQPKSTQTMTKCVSNMYASLFVVSEIELHSHLYRFNNIHSFGICWCVWCMNTNGNNNQRYRTERNWVLKIVRNKNTYAILMCTWTSPSLDVYCVCMCMLYTQNFTLTHFHSAFASNYHLYYGIVLKTTESPVSLVCRRFFFYFS